MVSHIKLKACIAAYIILTSLYYRSGVLRFTLDSVNIPISFGAMYTMYKYLDTRPAVQQTIINSLMKMMVICFAILTLREYIWSLLMNILYVSTSLLQIEPWTRNGSMYPSHYISSRLRIIVQSWLKRSLLSYTVFSALKESASTASWCVYNGNISLASDPDNSRCLGGIDCKCCSDWVFSYQDWRKGGGRGGV